MPNPALTQVAGIGSARRRTPSRDVERALLTAAESVLVRDGMEGVTVRAVAAAAQVAPMGIYNRFGDKQGLITALVIRSYELLSEALAGVSETEPLVRLKLMGEAYRDFGVRHPEHYRLIFQTVATADTKGDPGVARVARSTFEALTAQILDAMVAGAIRPADPRVVAQQIWCVIHGAVALELGNRLISSQPAQSYTALLDLIISGLTSNSPD